MRERQFRVGNPSAMRTPQPLCAALLLLTALSCPSDANNGALPTAANPALVRWSFGVSEERRDEFLPLFEAQILPELKRLGLRPSPVTVPTTVDDAFSRLFELESVDDLKALLDSLEVEQAREGAYPRAIDALKARFRRPDGEDPWHELGLYHATGIEGQVVKAGPGTHPWRTYDATKGLKSSEVSDLFQDRDGVMWFGSGGGGVDRFDGHEFSQLTPADGLPHGWVTSIFQDHRGAMWFGTWGAGVSRYDGEGFENFGPENGLSGSRVTALGEDEEGRLWVGTEARGVSLYDGGEWVTLMTEDGLPSDRISAIARDRAGNMWVMATA